MVSEARSALGPLPLNNVLGKNDTQLVCPHFQRRFQWKKDHFNSLWQDLDAVLTEASDALFLGAFIFKTPQGHPLAAKTSLIIDGQQRLTTIQLIIAAASTVASENNLPDLAQSIGRYLFLSHESMNGKPKFVPTTFDVPQYSKVLRGLNIDKVDIPFDQNVPEAGLVLTAFDQNLKMLRDRVSQEDEIEEYLNFFIDRLLTTLHVIHVEIDDRFQVNEVFDRLNRVGAKLNLVDLVRNEIFRRFGSGYNSNDAKKLYKHLWIPFESSVGTKYIDRLFFPYALIQNPNTTQARAFSELSSHWSSELESKDGNDADAAAFAELVVEDLNYYKSAFVGLTQGIRPADISDEVWKVVHSLYLMPAPAAVYPFILKLLSDHIAGKFTGDFTRQSLLLTESFLIRRAFQGLEPTGLHAVFKRAFSSSAGKGEDLEQVAKSFTSSTIKFPSDKDFRKSISTLDLYGRRISKYVLLEYERNCRKYTKLADKTYTDKNVTIDHVMPQSISGDWLKDFGPSGLHAKYVDSWANLVLLARPLNSLKSTHSYKESVNLVSDENEFTSTSQLFNSNNLWNEASITKRQKEIANFALKRWPKDAILKAD